MKGGSKTLTAALVALLLAVGLAACGGRSDSGSTGAEATSARDGGGEETGSGEGGTSFKPRPHHDSGGGSAQYLVKGGDNSIQEFGSEVEGSEFEKAATALHDFLDARAAGDAAAACSYMSKSVIESFKQLAAKSTQGGGTSCATILEELTNPAAKPAMKAEAAQADVGSLRVEGERAFLIYTGAGKTVLAIPMADEGGTWKVAGLAGTPLS